MKKSVFIALFILIAATLWILSGVRSDLFAPNGAKNNIEEVVQLKSTEQKDKIQEVRVLSLIHI